jgi:RNA polymerase sigma factor (sigma-70 family)
MNRLLEQLRRVALHSAVERLSDGELLECFVARRDEAAFEALVRRHGPMVFGVCRRVLRHVHDADDAFQATFLVLVRRASSVRPREAVGNWLHGVAYRTALEARRRTARQQLRERRLGRLPPAVEPPDEGWPELRALLDQEVSRLPDKYRLPVVLCELEGRSRKEVARQLAIPEGTLSSRLALARKRLARRLARHGLALAAAPLAVVLAESGASAAVPAALVTATTRAAVLVAAGHAAGVGMVSVQVAALTKGVMKAMLFAKIKTATVVVFGVTAVGAGGLLYQARADERNVAAADRQQLVARADDSDPRQRDVQREERRAADAAAERERALRQELERARREAEAMRAQALALRDQAEAQKRIADAERAKAEDGMRRAEAQLKRALEAEQAARQDARKQLYAAQVQQAQRDYERAGRLRAADARQVGNAERARLEEMKAKALADLDARRAELQTQFEEQLRQLDAKRQEVLAKLDAELARLQQERMKAQPPARRNADPVSAVGDKLDRILERLEQMERRLQRLEQQKAH